MRNRHTRLAALMFGALAAAPATTAARAECWTHDALHNGIFAAKAPDIAVASAAAMPIWKTIVVGTTIVKSELRDELYRAGCGTSPAAQNILAQPRFAISTAPLEVDLVDVSLAELGFRDGSVSLATVYERARTLGFQLAAAEVGPQLRLQYFAQPIGEFLNIAMTPIKSPRDEPGIFVVANGGAGLLLLTHGDTDFFPSSRFVFVRPTKIATTQRP
jgi:hypothetical protein